MSIHIDFEWVEVQRSPDVVSQLSMAELCIKVDKSVVTRVIDRNQRSLRDRIVVPMFSIAEWLVFNWWHLFHEVGNNGEQRQDFASRHDLVFSDDGFAYPSLTLTPQSESIRLRWRRNQPQYADIEFVNEGWADVKREDLASQAKNIIESVLDRLRGRDADVEALEAEWKAINDLNPDERDFCCAAALFGEDPFDLEDALADEIRALWENAEPSLREDALAAADADGLMKIRTWLAKNLKKLADADGGDWPELRKKLPQIDNVSNWEHGHQLARAVRSELGIQSSRFNFESDGPLALRPRTAHRPAARVEGLVAAESPACIAVQKRETGKRFLAARALGDYLSKSDPGAGLLCSLETDRQARTRAFAAEFLAPSDALDRRLRGRRVISDDDVEDLANEFGVSCWLISRQIENHELATVAAW